MADSDMDLSDSLGMWLRRTGHHLLGALSLDHADAVPDLSFAPGCARVNQAMRCLRQCVAM